MNANGDAYPGDRPAELSDAGLLAVALDTLRLGRKPAGELLGCDARQVGRMRAGTLEVRPEGWHALAAALQARATLNVRANWLARECRRRAGQ